MRNDQAIWLSSMLMNDDEIRVIFLDALLREFFHHQRSSVQSRAVRENQSGFL
jgi:hypothetical protein